MKALLIGYDLDCRTWRMVFDDAAYAEDFAFDYGIDIEVLKTITDDEAEKVVEIEH